MASSHCAHFVCRLRGTVGCVCYIDVSLTNMANIRSIMAMIRGTGSKFPCPMCLIPGSELSNMTASYRLRTTAGMSAVLASTEGMTATEKEEVLKDHGLRDIKVC
jgi:hypothetical protein